MQNQMRCYWRAPAWRYSDDLERPSLLCFDLPLFMPSLVCCCCERRGLHPFACQRQSFNHLLLCCFISRMKVNFVILGQIASNFAPKAGIVYIDLDLQVALPFTSQSLLLVVVISPLMSLKSGNMGAKNMIVIVLKGFQSEGCYASIRKVET